MGFLCPNKPNFQKITKKINAKPNGFVTQVIHNYEQAEKLKERIRKLRQSGLEDKGAFSVENLAFKILRRTDYLRRLSSVKTMAYDKSMSINEE